jgi:hypothetical protein
MLKATLNGQGREIVELAKTNNLTLTRTFSNREGAMQCIESSPVEAVNTFTAWSEQRRGQVWLAPHDLDRQDETAGYHCRTNRHVTCGRHARQRPQHL